MHKIRKLAPKQWTDGNPALVSVSGGRQTHEEVPTSRDKAPSALSSTPSWNGPVTCQCVQGTAAPPFENLQFYVELGTYEARVCTTRTPSAGFRSQPPPGSPWFYPWQASENRFSPLARLDRSRANNVRFFSNNTTRLLLSSQ